MKPILHSTFKEWRFRKIKEANIKVGVIKSIYGYKPKIYKVFSRKSKFFVVVEPKRLVRI